MEKRFPLKIFLLSLFFFAVYIGFFYLFRDWLDAGYNAITPDPDKLEELGLAHPSNARIVFSEFGGVMGLGFMAYCLVNSFFFWGIATLLKRGENILARFIVLLFVYGTLLIIGTDMAFFEDGYYELARSIKFYMGYPLFTSSAASVCIILATGIHTIITKKKCAEDTR